jgi:glycosyltransferase involved in cell wall biosynthesis
MALKAKNIEVTGWVPDIRNCYAASHIFIAPMRIGTGLQNKLLEAMSMKMPCITSQLANQALGAKINNEILVGTTANEYSAHIVKLLEDKNFADTVAINGQAFVKRVFSWENSTALLENLMKNKKTQ